MWKPKASICKTMRILCYLWLSSKQCTQYRLSSPHLYTVTGVEYCTPHCVPAKCCVWPEPRSHGLQEWREGSRSHTVTGSLHGLLHRGWSSFLASCFTLCPYAARHRIGSADGFACPLGREAVLPNRSCGLSQIPASLRVSVEGQSLHTSSSLVFQPPQVLFHLLLSKLGSFSAARSHSSEHFPLPVPTD